MKKASLLIFIILLILIFAKFRSDGAEVNVLRKDIVRITVIHISEERARTFLGKSAFKKTSERWITIIEFQRNGKRIMTESKDVYEMMLPWNNSIVVISYEENPFRLRGVRKMGLFHMALLVWPGELFFMR